MVLDDILTAKQTFLESLPPVIQPQAQQQRDNFLRKIQGTDFSIIAELKSQSPSEGTIKEHYDPVNIAKQYVEGGAACISVLTDEPFFGGSFIDLGKVRRAVDVPLLCKDFIIDERQVYLAKQNGADAVLLIVRILTSERLQHLKTVIEDLGMLPVIEVFNETDLQVALATDPCVLLVNNRDLNSLKVDMNNTQNLLDLVPDSIQVIAASGLTSTQDVKKYPQRIQTVLIGTMLMRANDPAHSIKEILQCRA